MMKQAFRGAVAILLAVLLAFSAFAGSIGGAAVDQVARAAAATADGHATTAAAAALVAHNEAIAASGVAATAAANASAALSGSANDSTARAAAVTVAITGGTINGASIGATTASTVRALTVLPTVSYNLNAVSLFPAGFPSVSSGFGASPVVTPLNGAVTFLVNVGSTVSSSGTVAMPAATDGWSCITQWVGLTNTGGMTIQTATTTTSVTFTNYAVGTGTLLNWPTSHVFRAICAAY